MRLRPRTWFVVSLLLFGAAALFWHLGDKRRNAARHDAAPAHSGIQPLTLTNPVAAATATAVAKTNSVRALATAAPALAKTNPFAFRLSNTERSIGELIHDNKALLLRNALYDTRNPQRPEIPEHLRAQGAPGSYIVQARDAITDAFRKQILQSGAELVSYIPNNAMLVRASEAQIQRIGKSAQVQAVLPFEPYYKLDGRLLPIAVEQKLSPYGLLNVVAFPRQTEQARLQIEQLGGAITSRPERTPFGDNLVVKVPAASLASLAQIPEVQMIGVHAQKRPMNDLSRIKTKVSPPPATNPPPAGQYGSPTTNDHLTGAGVLLAVSDTGVDPTHPDFTGRVTGVATDPDGHGTHVVGTILGDGTESLTIGVTNIGATNETNLVSLAMGSAANAWFSGMAPAARAFVQDYTASSDLDLQQNAASNNVTIVNNSWGYAGNEGDYDIFAASYDSAVRDSLPGVPGEQQLTFVFAAGNSGSGADTGLNGVADTVLSPATAKNVITVGGSELYRYITNEVIVGTCTYTTNGSVVSSNCVTSQPWLGMTDSSDQVARFSSRGNVGIGREGAAGRFKPDVVAPGAMVVSCRSANYVDPGDATTNSTADFFNALSIDASTTDEYVILLPGNCVAVDIITRPYTNVVFTLDAAMDSSPTAPPLGTGAINLTGTAIRSGGLLYFTIQNPTNFAVLYDLTIRFTVTNNVDNYYAVLKQINDPLKPYYRYEAGTSMSAAVASGVLALMEEFFRTQFGVTNSPAMNKALMINGARPLGVQYSYEVTSRANHQGWGMISISNSVPPRFVTGPQRPIWFFDQDPTNALATGDSHVYTVTVPPEAQAAPLRLTLVWTDPAGNPLSSTKLVNDLDLSVDGQLVSFQGTNKLSFAGKWLGNNFGSGSDYTQPLMLVDTNGNPLASTAIDAQVELARDVVNNVENVFIAPPLADTYSVVVRGKRVNVNAVNGHTNGIVQDYALVIATGNTS